MGVSGSGKSTIGALLADALAVPFVDGDSLHPPANVAKMSRGIPLDDSDRWPWLAAVGGALADAKLTGLVVACSALKREYRDAIRAEAPDAAFIELSVSREVLQQRMDARTDHFMPPSLLDSQLVTLEPLAPDERGAIVDASASETAIVEESAQAVRRLAE
jgi:gluconokinase